jgi:hypothetical protein
LRYAELLTDARKKTIASSEPAGEVKLTNAERKAKHAEANKQLWQAAYVRQSQCEASMY